MAVALVRSESAPRAEMCVWRQSKKISGGSRLNVAQQLSSIVIDSYSSGTMKQKIRRGSCYERSSGEALDSHARSRVPLPHRCSDPPLGTLRIPFLDGREIVLTKSVSDSFS